MAVIHDNDKALMIKNGEWRAGVAYWSCRFIWAAYIPPNASWPNLVKEWLRVGPVNRQTFINLVLGEP